MPSFKEILRTSIIVIVVLFIVKMVPPLKSFLS